MLKLNGYNFHNIKQIVEAAEKLQDAGKNDKADEILKELAQDILGERA